jgi:hypothetical protein
MVCFHHGEDAKPKQILMFNISGMKEISGHFLLYLKQAKAL